MRVEPLSIQPVAPATSKDMRVAERFGVGMPYTLNGQHGQTRDLSATGLSFDSSTQYAVGTVLELTVQYTLDGHNFPLRCQVEVIRVEPQGEGFAIAVRLCRPFFEPQA